MAAAPIDLVQHTPRYPETIRTTIRTTVPDAERAAGPELQAAVSQLHGTEHNALSPISKLPTAGSVPPGAYTILQSAGALSPKPFLFRSIPKLFGTEPELFTAAVLATAVFIQFLRLFRRKQKPEMRTA